MWHRNRTFNVVDLSEPEELLEKLKEHTWTLCAGWRLNGWLWLNDSLSEDGAHEYAVVHEQTMIQWESLTISWMSPEDVIAFIRMFNVGTAPGPFFPNPVTNKLDTPEEHGRCHLCA